MIHYTFICILVLFLCHYFPTKSNAEISQSSFTDSFDRLESDQINDGIIELTIDNFGRLKEEHPTIFAYFKFDNKNDIAITKTVEYVAELLRNKNVLVTKVTDKQLVQSLGINESGTFYAFHNGHRFQFYGYPKSDTIMHFILQVQEPLVKVITGKETKIAFDKVDVPKIVAYFEEESEEYFVFEEAALSYLPYVQFYATFDETVAKHLKLEDPGTYRYKCPLAEKSILIECDTVDDIIDVIETQKFGALQKFSLHTIYHPWNTVSSGEEYIAFIDPKSPKGKTFHKILKKYMKKPTEDSGVGITITWINPSEYPLMIPIWENKYDIDLKEPHFGHITELETRWLDIQRLEDLEGKEEKKSVLTKWIRNKEDPYTPEKPKSEETDEEDDDEAEEKNNSMGQLENITLNGDQKYYENGDGCSTGDCNHKSTEDDDDEDEDEISTEHENDEELDEAESDGIQKDGDLKVPEIGKKEPVPDITNKKSKSTIDYEGNFEEEDEEEEEDDWVSYLEELYYDEQEKVNDRIHDGDTDVKMTKIGESDRRKGETLNEEDKAGNNRPMDEDKNADISCGKDKTINCNKDINNIVETVAKDRNNRFKTLENSEKSQELKEEIQESLTEQVQEKAEELQEVTDEILEKTIEAVQENVEEDIEAEENENDEDDYEGVKVTDEDILTDYEKLKAENEALRKENAELKEELKEAENEDDDDDDDEDDDDDDEEEEEKEEEEEEENSIVNEVVSTSKTSYNEEESVAYKTEDYPAYNDDVNVLVDSFKNTESDDWKNYFDELEAEENKKLDEKARKNKKKVQRKGGSLFFAEGKKIPDSNLFENDQLPTNTNDGNTNGNTIKETDNNREQQDDLKEESSHVKNIEIEEQDTDRLSINRVLAVLVEEVEKVLHENKAGQAEDCMTLGPQETKSETSEDSAEYNLNDEINLEDIQENENSHEEISETFGILPDDIDLTDPESIVNTIKHTRDVANKLIQEFAETITAQVLEGKSAKRLYVKNTDDDDEEEGDPWEILEERNEKLRKLCKKGRLSTADCNQVIHGRSMEHVHNFQRAKSPRIPRFKPSASFPEEQEHDKPEEKKAHTGEKSSQSQEYMKENDLLDREKKQGLNDATLEAEIQLDTHEADIMSETGTNFDKSIFDDEETLERKRDEQFYYKFEDWEIPAPYTEQNTDTFDYNSRNYFDEMEKAELANGETATVTESANIQSEISGEEESQDNSMVKEKNATKCTCEKERKKFKKEKKKHFDEEEWENVKYQDKQKFKHETDNTQPCDCKWKLLSNP